MKKSNIWHTYPLNDKLEHQTTGFGCICHPKIKHQLEGTMVVHNSFDGREYKEKGSKLLVN